MLGPSPSVGRSVLFVPEHFEHISVDAWTDFSSNPQNQCQTYIGIIFLCISLQIVKCGTRNICVVNGVHLIHLD